MANLKLQYAQFEELETFSRFGTRLDENTTKIIEHGKHIRACLVQQELKPMSVSDQLIGLLALTDGLFDSIPIDDIKQAEDALLKANEQHAYEWKAFFSDKALSDADRETIIKVATDALPLFHKET